MRIKRVVRVNDEYQVDALTCYEGNITVWWVFKPLRVRTGVCRDGIYVAYNYEYDGFEEVFALTNAGKRIIVADYSEKNLEYYFGDEKNDFREMRFEDFSYAWRYMTKPHTPLMPLQTHLIFQAKLNEELTQAQLFAWKLCTELEELLLCRSSLVKVWSAVMELELAGFWLYDEHLDEKDKTLKQLDESVAWGWKTFEKAKNELKYICSNKEEFRESLGCGEARLSVCAL